MSHASWQPFYLPRELPVPMVSPGEVDPERDVVINADDAAFLSLGLGDVEFPWDVHSQLIWRWANDGVLTFFHGKTRREFMRLRMTPLDLAPGPSAWRVNEAIFEYDDRTGVRDTAAALSQVDVVLSEATAFRRLLTDVPHDGEDALSRLRPPDMPSVAVHLQAAAIALQLPALVEELVIRHMHVPVPSGTHVLTARPDRDSVRLDMEGDAVLWLTQAHGMVIKERRLATDAGGALFWPGEWMPESALASLGAYHDIPGRSVTHVTPNMHALTHTGEYVEEKDLSPVVGSAHSRAICALRIKPAQER